MNTNELGGAERSLVFQLTNKPDSDFTFYIPKISKGNALETFLHESGFKKVIYYSYPESIYRVSRSQLRFSLSLLKGAADILAFRKHFPKLAGFDVVYLNGNKAALLFFMYNHFTKFKGTVVWHLRDYYHASAITNFLWKLIDNTSRTGLHFVCNSNSVKKSLGSSPWSKHKTEVIYNPAGNQSAIRDTIRPIETIGFVSMMAPWKGVHEIVLWSKLFEKELCQLGVKAIKIYGGDIYKTNGTHSDYCQQLNKLNEKLDCDILSLEGERKPEEIFQEIDLLIHYSLEPEPFGRVILEAFKAGIPVISTCLGGAAELVESQVNGVKVYPHDRRGLFLAVEQLIENKVKTFKLITRGFEKSETIQKDIHNNMARVLDTKEAS